MISHEFVQGIPKFIELSKDQINLAEGSNPTSLRKLMSWTICCGGRVAFESMRVFKS